MVEQVNIAILGASGYTGAELVRLLTHHPKARIGAITADRKAGESYGAVYPHLAGLDLPPLTTIDALNWDDFDVIFCGLPHGTTQEITSTIFAKYPHVKVIDMSADFRLRDAETYAEWYGHEHQASDLQGEAVYGLTEHYRESIADARLIACPGCYPTAALTALLPVVSAGLVDAGDIIIDAKSGISGAGRGLKQNTLFCEAGEGMSPYSVAKHRHAPEIEQEIGVAAGRKVIVNFTPHLVPMSRGELVTCYVRLTDGASAEDVRTALVRRYADEPFVRVLPSGQLPSTQAVRGSNYVLVGAFADRVPGRAIIIAALDNLVKGSAGQALQNMNVAFGLPETTGLQQLPLFP